VGHLLLRVMSHYRKRRKKDEAMPLDPFGVLPWEMMVYIFEWSAPFGLAISLVSKPWRDIWKQGFDNPERIRSDAMDLHRWCIQKDRERDQVLEAERESIVSIRHGPLQEARLTEWGKRYSDYLEEQTRRKGFWTHLSPSLRCGKWASAAASGRTNVLDYLQNRHFTRRQGDTPFWWEGTAKAPSGHPLLQEHDVPQDALLEASRAGHVHVLEWFIENAYVHYTHELALVAAQAQQWSVLWFVAKHQLPCTKEATTAVARHNQLELLKALRQPPNRAAWDAGVCAWAVANGNDEMLRWAAENGCPCPSEFRPTLD
jgi:hypothetical protein